MPKLSQQEEDQEEFRLRAEDLFAKYDPESALEEAAVITIARALWMKRTHSEFNSETRRLDEEIDTALGQLHKSKLIRKSMDHSKRAMQNLSTRRNTFHHGLIQRPVMSKARPRLDTLELLARWLRQLIPILS